MRRVVEAHVFTALCSVRCVPQRGSATDTGTASNLSLEVIFPFNVHVLRIVSYRYHVPVH